MSFLDVFINCPFYGPDRSNYLHPDDTCPQEVNFSSTFCFLFRPFQGSMRYSQWNCLNDICDHNVNSGGCCRRSDCEHYVIFNCGETIVQFSLRLHSKTVHIFRFLQLFWRVKSGDFSQAIRGTLLGPKISELNCE